MKTLARYLTALFDFISEHTFAISVIYFHAAILISYYLHLF
jgi:hypothetical protein